MNKRARQYIGIFLAVTAYYIIHEGAHFIYAISAGAFRKVNFMGLGVQIDVFAEKMTDAEMGIMCILGSAATFVFGYLLVMLTGMICKARSAVFRASAYYVTIAMLAIDPLYLSILCDFFGGGDMNGIELLIPETAARIFYGILLLINVFVFFKVVLPKYKKSFE